MKSKKNRIARLTLISKIIRIIALVLFLGSIASGPVLGTVGSDIVGRDPHGLRFLIPIFLFIVSVLLIAASSNYKEAAKRVLEEVKEEEIREIKEQRKKILEQFEQTKAILESSTHRVLVERYVSTDQSGSENFEKLRQLLSDKGFSFEPDELRQIIDEEVQKQDYNHFRKLILHNRPENLRNYIVNLFDSYGEHHTEYIDFFRDLLKENKVIFDDYSLLSNITTVIWELKSERLQKELFYSEESYSVSDLDLLYRYEFEDFLKKLFEKMGYRVESTKGTGDQGVDLVVTKLGQRKVIQATNYAGKVGDKAILEVVAAIRHYGADDGMAVTTSEFTRPAIELAESNGIELVDRYKLEELIQEYW